MKELVPNKKSVLVPFVQSVLDSLNKSDLDGYSDNTNGCIFEHGKFAFVCKGSLLQIVNVKSGQQCSACDFSTIDQKVCVTCVISSARKFIVGLRCIGTASIGLLCVYDPGLSRIVKTIKLSGIPTSIALIREFGGVSIETSMFSPVLRPLFGIIAVGTEDGHLLLIDLRADDESIEGQTITSPSKLLYVDTVDMHDIPKMRDKARGAAQHCCLDLTNEFVTPSGFKYSMPNAKAKLCEKNNCGITSLLYLKQSISLVVGYSFGAFQVWSLGTLKIIYSSPLVLASPVCHFTYQEPENDPRSCLFLWVGRGPLPSQSICINPTSVTMYQIVYADKELISGYGVLYKQLGMVAKRFEHQLTGDVHHLVDSMSVGSRIISFKTLESTDSTVCVVVWETPVTPTNMNLTCHIGIFDLNCYYEKQLPSSVREAMYGKMEAVCPFFAFYSLTDVAEDFIPTGILDVFLDPQSINWFRTSVPPQVEQFSWPSSASFQLTCLSEGGTIGVEMLGMQKQIISNMIDMGPDSFLDISKLIQQCCIAGLLHSSYSCIKENEESLYTDALLSIALDNGGMVFITSCIRKWSHGSITHAGHSLKLLHDWAWAQVVQRKRFLDELHFFLFGSADEGLDEGQLNQLKRISVQLRDLTEILKELQNSKASSLEEGIKELAMKSQVTLHLTMYADILLLLVDSQLLPEQTDALHKNKPTYNAQLLSEYYEVRRNIAGTDDHLFIDAMWKNMHFPETLKEENNVVLYPPSSVEVMCSLFVHNMLNERKKCCYIFYYWFLDICECFTDLHDKNAESKFRQFMQLESNEELLVKSIWLLDHKLYNEAVTHLLVVDVNISSVYYHHIVKLLYEEKQRDLLALFFANKQPNDSCTVDQMKFLTYVMLDLGKLSNAYGLQSTSIYTAQKENLFNYFIEQCIQNQLFQKLFMLPLNLEEENILHNYLMASKDTEDYLLVYYLERGLYNEASKLTKSLQAVSTLKLDQISQDRLQIQCLLANGFSQTIPHIQHKRNEIIEHIDSYEFKSPLSSILLKGEKNVAHNVFMSASKEELNFSMNNSAKRRKCPLFEAEPVFSKKPRDMDISMNVEMSSPVSTQESSSTKDSNPLSLLTTPASAKRRYSKISVSTLNKPPQSILKLKSHIQQEIDTPISSGKRIRFVDAKSPDSPSLDGSFIDSHNKVEISFVSNNADSSFESVSEGELDDEKIEASDIINADTEIMVNNEPIYKGNQSKSLDIENILSDLENGDELVEQPVKYRRLSLLAQESIKEILSKSRQIEMDTEVMESEVAAVGVFPKLPHKIMETEGVAVKVGIVSSVPAIHTESDAIISSKPSDIPDLVTVHDASHKSDLISATETTTIDEEINDKSDIHVDEIDKTGDHILSDDADNDSEIIELNPNNLSTKHNLNYIIPSDQCIQQEKVVDDSPEVGYASSLVSEIPSTGAASDAEKSDSHVSIKNEEGEIVISDDDDGDDDDDDELDETTSDDSDESENESNSEVDNGNAEEKTITKELVLDEEDIYENMDPADGFDEEDIYENMDIGEENEKINDLYQFPVTAPVTNVLTEMSSYIEDSNINDLVDQGKHADVLPSELMAKPLGKTILEDGGSLSEKVLSDKGKQPHFSKETEIPDEIVETSQSIITLNTNIEQVMQQYDEKEEDPETIEDCVQEADDRPENVIDIVDIDDDDETDGEINDDNNEDIDDPDFEEEHAVFEDVEVGNVEDGEIDTEDSQYGDSDESDSGGYDEDSASEDDLSHITENRPSHAIVVLDDDDEDDNDDKDVDECAENFDINKNQDGERNLSSVIEEVFQDTEKKEMPHTEVSEYSELETDKLSTVIEDKKDENYFLEEAYIPVSPEMVNNVEIDQKLEDMGRVCDFELIETEKYDDFIKESPVLIDLPSVNSEAAVRVIENNEDNKIKEPISEIQHIPKQIDSRLNDVTPGNDKGIVMEICEPADLQTSGNVSQLRLEDVSEGDRTKAIEEMEVSSESSVKITLDQKVNMGEKRIIGNEAREDMEISVTSDDTFVFPKSVVRASELEHVDEAMDDPEYQNTCIEICSTPIHSHDLHEQETDTTALSTICEISVDEMCVDIEGQDVLGNKPNVKIDDEDENMNDDEPFILTESNIQLSQIVEVAHGSIIDNSKHVKSPNLSGNEIKQIAASPSNMSPARSPIFLPSKVADADSPSDKSSDENTSVVTPVRALRRRTVYRRDHLTQRTNKFRIKPDASLGPEELNENDAQVSDSDAQVFEERYKTAQAAYEIKSETKTLPRRTRTLRRKVSESHSDSSASSVDSHNRVGEGSSKYFTIDDDKSSDDEIEIESEDLEIYLGLKRNTAGRVRGHLKEHDMEPIKEESSLLEGRGDDNMHVDIDIVSSTKEENGMEQSDPLETSPTQKSKVGVSSEEMIDKSPDKEVEESSGTDDPADDTASRTKRLTRSQLRSEPRETRSRGSTRGSQLNSASRKTKLAMKTNKPFSEKNESSFNKLSELGYLVPAAINSQILEVRVEELSPELSPFRNENELVVNMDKLAPLSSEETQYVEESSTDTETETITRRSTRAQNKTTTRTTRSGRKPASDQRVQSKSAKPSPKKMSKKLKPSTEPIETVEPIEVIKYQSPKIDRYKGKGSKARNVRVSHSSEEESEEVPDEVFVPRTTRSHKTAYISPPVLKTMKSRRSTSPGNEDVLTTDLSQVVHSDAIVKRNDKDSKTEASYQTIPDQSIMPKVDETMSEKGDNSESTKSWREQKTMAWRFNKSRSNMQAGQNQSLTEVPKAINSVADINSKTFTKTRSTRQNNVQQTLPDTANVETSINIATHEANSGQILETEESSFLADTSTKTLRSTRSTRQATSIQLTEASEVTSSDVMDIKDKTPSPVKIKKSPIKTFTKGRVSRSTATRKLRNRDVKT